jgi:DNA-binding NtrC family response regulator
MPQQAGKKILFVDDEDSIRLTLPMVLEQRGFQVNVAATVSDALSKINNQPFDVLVSDLNIGEAGDGFTVVKAVRRANPKCVTIILTGYPAFESALEGIHHEIDDYVVKPADIDALITVMERKLAARQFK